MANPSPKLENLKPFTPVGDAPLAEKQLQVRVAQDIDAAIRALGKDKTEWLRRVITEAANRELMSDRNF